MSELKLLTGSGGSTLPAMTEMHVGQYLDSPSKQYRLLFGDSGLVLFDGSSAIWEANINQAHSNAYKIKKLKGVARVEMVFYLQMIQPQRNHMWSTVGYSSLGGDNESSRLRAFLSLQDDGNLAVSVTKCNA